MVFVNIKVVKVSKEDNTFLAINLISHPSMIRTAKQEFLAENHKGVVKKEVIRNYEKYYSLV